MDYALKRYAPDASKNAYWVELAERVERDYVESFEEIIMPPKPKAAGV
jgi:cytochrome c551/c552